MTVSSSASGPDVKLIGHIPFVGLPIVASSADGRNRARQEARYAGAWLAVVLACGAASTASAEPPTPASPLPEIALPTPLARVLSDYEAAWQAKDAAALAALFAEDGFVLASGTPPVRGRKAIQELYAGKGGPLALHAFAFGTAGSVGYIVGGFSRQRGEPDVGKFTLTLRKSSGRWWITSDMDNGNSRR